ncbi:MAG: DUF3137 domain-containing protein [Candidatus Omnitrophota bacterium]|nr:DUF3137 domain-containing protein [Candidatus Omnitrophota bacterium]
MFIFWVIVILVVIGLGMESVLSYKKKIEAINNLLMLLRITYNGEIFKNNFKVDTTAVSAFYPALKFSLENAQAYLLMDTNSMEFIVESSALNSYAEIWFEEGPVLIANPPKTDNPRFDKLFKLWKAPRDKIKLHSILTPELQEKIVQLKNEVTKEVQNVYLKGLHSKQHGGGKTDRFTIRISSSQIYGGVLMGMGKLQPRDITIYKTILDKCIDIYKTFVEAGRNN